MNPDVGTPDIHTIQATPVAAPNDEIVDLAIRARVHGEMERRGIDEGYIVNAEIGDLYERGGQKEAH